MSVSQVAVLVVAILGGGGIGAIIVKWMGRNVDRADAGERRANANQTEVETLREIIAEVRTSEAKKDTRIDALEVRLDKLEERERHMLTRAAVHEAWDQLAFEMLRTQNPMYPPPPPLVPKSIEGPEDN